MRKVGILLAILLAILCGAVASALAYAYLKNQTTVTGPELQPVVVATADLTFGRTLKKEDLDLVLYPKGSIPTGAYSHPDSLVNQTTKVFLKKNEPILNSKLSSIGGGLSLLISPDMRAASIKVDKVSGVSGFVLPGDRVDVIASIVRYGSSESVAKTILQNVEVLAAGEATENKGDKVITVQAVTLLLEPEGAQALALAFQMGKLHLALRNPSDQEVLAMEPITKTSMMGEKKKSEPKPKSTYTPKKKASPPKKKEEPVVKSDSLVIIRGADKKTEAPVMKDEENKKK